MYALFVCVFFLFSFACTEPKNQFKIYGANANCRKRIIFTFSKWLRRPSLLHRKICSFSEMQWVRRVFSLSNCTTFNFKLQVEMFALKCLCSIKCKNHLVVYPGTFWNLLFHSMLPIKKFTSKITLLFFCRKFNVFHIKTVHKLDVQFKWTTKGVYFSCEFHYGSYHENFNSKLRHVISCACIYSIGYRNILMHVLGIPNLFLFFFCILKLYRFISHPSRYTAIFEGCHIWVGVAI